MVKRHRILSFLICVGLIAVFVGCASTPKREGTGEYLDDSAITTKVKAAIFNEPSLKVFQINVETFKGERPVERFCRFGPERQKGRRGCPRRQGCPIGEKQPDREIAAAPV